MIGMTMCSGIGAPETAAPEIDWRFASEIEDFPRAVLKQKFGYRLPEDHNQGEPLLWGDMTEITPDLLLSRGIPLPELIVAGTPCQAFSISGARKGVADERGNLTLKFVEICHAIVDAKPDGKLAILWENVPGVLSDKENAFGCFLAGLVGADDPLCTPDGGSWPSVGMVAGPRSRAAWRILDAQYFGLAQRRRRVFVVVDFGGAIDPAKILFERQSGTGNSPPRREKGQDVTGTLDESAGMRGQPEADRGQLVAGAWPADLAPTLNAAFGDKMGLEDQHINSNAPLFVPGVNVARRVAHGEYVEDNVSGTLTQRDYKDATDLITHTLRGDGFDASEDGTGRGTPIVPVAFSSKDNGRDATLNLSPALRAGGHDNSHQNGGVPPAVAYDLRGREGGVQFEGPHETANIRAASGGSSRSYVAEATAVRRLMPVECARLQGFPDDHLDIEFRGKPAGDGNKYKAIGNSMAVPKIRWILKRIIESWEQ